MATSKTKRGLIALFTLPSLVLLSSGAQATHSTTAAISGLGAGGGTEDGGDITGQCAQPLRGTFSGSRFELTHVGTYEGVDPDNGQTALYSGPTTVVINTGAYVIDPEGTYINCTTPGPVPINSATVTSPPAGLNGGDVKCQTLTGTFNRRAAEVVTFTLQGQCTVRGNVPPRQGTVTDHSTTHVITGTMTPCLIAPAPECADPAIDSVLTTEYQVSPT
ncbi:MAG: hypothetical protein H0U53_07095 [Actinobacteria bacterium]|nr:hypothetical protein [Actinomycetota bacterium]